MKKLVFYIVTIIAGYNGYAQVGTSEIQRPRLIVGIAVDQMRWDYLYRYYARYTENGGFKRLMNNGFNCENTSLPYVPSVTACGHTSMYTGTVPAIHGITGNDWWDEVLNDFRYCTDDSSARTVGSNTTAAGAMSPANLLTTTICDELKLSTNFKSKVFGIALKDRCGILPIGHSGDGAFWYDTKTGNWISSTYYMNQLPQYISSFNSRKLVDSFYLKGWTTLHPINTYVQSTADNVPYENKLFGNNFPYDLSKLAGKNYNPFISTPYGNTLTTMLAKEIIEHENLGKDDITDFLSISYSAPDYVGHSFGPNSVEEEDVFLRLDKELGEFMDHLDAKVGKNRYLLFLTADHGVAHVPAFLKQNKIPAGNVPVVSIHDSLSANLQQQFGKADLLIAIINYQVVLNRKLIDSLKMNKQQIIDWTIKYLQKQPGITHAVEIRTIMDAPLNSIIKNKIINGYFPKRSGDIHILFAPHWIEEFRQSGTTHGVWNPYDARIPLIWYGWNIKHGKTTQQLSITDIAPTLAAILKIQEPSGSIGQPIAEIIK